MSSTNGTNGTSAAPSQSSFAVKAGLAQMLKGGVIMDVVDAEQAKIAEEAGACAVMALERVPADIRAQGGVARMSDPAMIKEIMNTVTIPVMAKARIGHIVECQVLQAIGVDYIDESEVLTPADPVNHVDKNNFDTPFVCGCRNLGEALRRISEGAAMIRTKGEAGTGDVIEAVRHMQTVNAEIARASSASDNDLRQMARELECDYALLKETARKGRLPVVNFAAGGVATPADAALMMQMGCDGVFVGSGIFKSGNPAKRAKAIVQAVTHYKDPKVIARASSASDNDLRQMARELECDYALLKETARKGRLPVVNFAAGGVATPADAALMMQMGCDGVFVGSGIFKSGNPAKRAKAIVQAVTHYKDPKVIAEVSIGLGEAIVGINCGEMRDTEKLATRGW